MSDGCHALRLEIRNRLDDLVAELDPADSFIPFLNAGRLAVNLDLEPDTADAGRLHRQIAGFSGYAGISPVAADHRVQRPVSADLFIDDDIDVHVAFRL